LNEELGITSHEESGSDVVEIVVDEGKLFDGKADGAFATCPPVFRRWRRDWTDWHVHFHCFQIVTLFVA
jgi:hypothetical protein